MKLHLICKYLGLALGSFSGLLLLAGVIGFFTGPFLSVVNYWNYFWFASPFIAICNLLYDCLHSLQRRAQGIGELSRY